MSDSPLIEHFDKALAALAKGKTGISLSFTTPGAAISFRAKMNKCRSDIRSQNKRVYPFDSPHHGTSPYDHLSLHIPPDSPALVIIRRADYTPPVESQEID